MRIKGLQPLLLVFVGILIVLIPSRAGAQVSIGSRIEVGGDYNWIHSNAPPGGCGCFSGYGGDGWASVRLTSQFSLAGEGATQNATKVNGTAAGIRIISFLAGPRFEVHSRRRLAPFGKVLVGGAHASGELTPLSSGVAGSATVFAFTAGGGADFGITPAFSVRLVDAEYFYTRFVNGTNDHQNNIRLAAGIVIHLGSGGGR